VRAVLLDGRLDPFGENRHLRLDLLEPTETPEGEIRTDAGRGAKEPGSLVTLPLRGESSDLRPVARNQDHQVGVQTVLHPGALGDELVTVVDEELEILVCSAPQRRRQMLIPGHHPGDG